MSVEVVRNWLVYLKLAVGVLLIASILRTKFYRRSPFFSLYVLADEVWEIVRLAHGSTRARIQFDYMAGDALELILISLAVREVSHVSFEPYPGLAEFLKRTSGYLAVASALLSLLFAALDPSVPWTVNHLLQHFYTLERTVYSTLLIYILAVSGFMAWFPVRIRRNAAVFIGAFAAFFASQCAALLTANWTQRTAPLLTIITLAVSVVCMIGWAGALRWRADEVMVVTGIRWNPGVLARLTAQLEAINASLARFLRARGKYS